MAGPSKQQQLQKIANELDAHYPGTGIGDKFLTFAQAHPKFTVKQVEDGFAAEVAAGAFGATIKKGFGSGGAIFGKGIVSAAGGAAKASGQINSLTGIAQTLTGIAQIGAVLEAFYRTITDGKFWRSLGWIALGVLLFIGAAALWLKGSVTDTVAGLL